MQFDRRIAGIGGRLVTLLCRRPVLVAVRSIESELGLQSLGQQRSKTPPKQKKPPCGGFFLAAQIAQTQRAYFEAAAAGAEAASAAGAAEAAGAGAGAGAAAGAGAGAGASSFLPHAARAAAAITAAKTSDLFILMIT
jgi:hypothetical protein